MQLPQNFIQTIESVFEEDGKQFIKRLPQLIEEVSTFWNLRDIQPVSNLSFNFVAFAKRADEDVILKMGVPHDELTSEISALKLFNGNGACQLLESDEEKGFLLLERLKPGKMLSELEDDDERTQIAMDVMLNMHHRNEVSSPKGRETLHLHQKFIKLSDWFDGLKKIRPHFDGGTGPFPKKILTRVKTSLPELFADENILLHGDFHHYNILSSHRGWLIIDPKGVIGPAGYEIGPLMLNPWKSFSDSSNFQIMAKRRIDIIHERTGWEKEKIIAWAMAHAVLSAWWSIEENMADNFTMECAKIFAGLK